jgi:sarcosine oxidase
VIIEGTLQTRVPLAYDVIVVGLGAMGSAAVFHLARSGQRVLGIDRFRPRHTLGSSHGESRIIREAYFEHPCYVPLVQRAYELWDELAAITGTRLFVQTGGLMIGSPEGVVVSGARRSAEMHHLPFEQLTAEEAARRFPAIRPAHGMLAILEPRAGALFPEKCVSSHLQAGHRAGATLQFDEPVLRWEPDGGGVRVQTVNETYSAGRMVITAGSWAQSLLPGSPLQLTVERQVLYWFSPREPDVFRPEKCPIHLWEFAPRRFFYGFPNLGTGVKLAVHHEGEVTNPDRVRQDVTGAEIAAMREIVRPFFPHLGDEVLKTAVCIYTNTRDEHFLIDSHPQHPQVLVVSPCSGHGFKFSSAIGEVVRDLVVDGKSRFDLSLFEWR